MVIGLHPTALPSWARMKYSYLAATSRVCTVAVPRGMPTIISVPNGVSAKAMEGEASMAHAVQKFTECARQHPELTFLVTAVGCGIAGYTPDEVAPLFKEAAALENVYLPQVFVDVMFK